MVSGIQSAVVPFRQCKLTELLFSNSFPAPSGAASHHHHHHYHHSGGGRPKPQKAIMIVTADPLGDFNATSQILRYSALAREVTVPRMPSVASAILSATAAAAAAKAGGVGGGQQLQQMLLSSGRTTPTTAAASTEELAFTAREMARLSEEVESLNIRLAEEQNRRHEAELALQALQERCDIMDQEIREECWAEAERQLEEERAKWKGAWYEEVRASKRGNFSQT